MILPSTTIEKELLNKGKQVIIGADEAGRGPLAGPVVASAVWIKPEVLEEDFLLRKFIRDSKLLSSKRREEVSDFLQNHPGVVVGIGQVSHVIIDRINILNASLLAMRIAVEEVFDQVGDSGTDKAVVLIDGNKRIPKVTFEQQMFPRGDKNIFSIAAASICAKVFRDHLMDKYHVTYPIYGFDRHRGYGTAYHMEMLKKSGPCDIHRKSFAPVRQQLKQK